MANTFLNLYNNSPSATIRAPESSATSVTRRSTHPLSADATSCRIVDAPQLEQEMVSWARGYIQQHAQHQPSRVLQWAIPFTSGVLRRHRLTNQETVMTLYDAIKNWSVQFVQEADRLSEDTIEIRQCEITDGVQPDREQWVNNGEVRMIVEHKSWHIFEHYCTGIRDLATANNGNGSDVVQKSNADGIGEKAIVLKLGSVMIAHKCLFGMLFGGLRFIMFALTDVIGDDGRIRHVLQCSRILDTGSTSGGPDAIKITIAALLGRKGAICGALNLPSGIRVGADEGKVLRSRTVGVKTPNNQGKPTRNGKARDRRGALNISSGIRVGADEGKVLRSRTVGVKAPNDQGKPTRKGKARDRRGVVGKGRAKGGAKARSKAKQSSRGNLSEKGKARKISGSRAVESKISRIRALPEICWWYDAGPERKFLFKRADAGGANEENASSSDAGVPQHTANLILDTCNWLGSGASGVVFSAELEVDGEYLEVAAKFFDPVVKVNEIDGDGVPYIDEQEDEHEYYFTNEITVYRRLTNSSISLQCYGGFRGNGFTGFDTGLIVLEKLEKSFEKFAEMTAVETQTAYCHILELHSRGIHHGDVRPQNFGRRVPVDNPNAAGDDSSNNTRITSQDREGSLVVFDFSLSDIFAACDPENCWELKEARRCIFDPAQ